MERNVSIIGAGRVGTAIAVSLRQGGLNVEAVVSRKKEDAEWLARKVDASRFGTAVRLACENSELIFITTSDREIAPVVDELAPYVASTALVAHTSGAYTSEVLSPVQERGASTLAMHPCQSFAEKTTAPKRLPGSYFCLEGDEKAVRKGKDLVEAMRCRSFVLPASDRPLYHIACTVASNYLVVLAERASSILEETGMRSEEALEILLPLLRGTLQNLQDLGASRSLTGPIERGDAETVVGQVGIVSDRIPNLKDLFTTLGREAVRVAVRKGSLTPREGERLSGLLE
jgi:predicted short-subunit dehydrogenase-like oxidoreductase (DUF2520 family)